MPLPVLTQPEFTGVFPSSDEDFKYSPMTIAQEKILLIAKEADDANDVLDAIVQIVGQCTKGKFKVSSLPLCDIEWAYLKIRAASVSNIAKLSFTEEGVTKPHEFEVDLDKVNMTKSKLKSKLIDIAPGVSLKMRYTPISVYTSKVYRDLEKTADQFDMIMLASIDQIIDGDEITVAANEDQTKLAEWFATIPSRSYEDIEKFFADAPKLHHEITYKDKDDKEQKIELSTLNDFFTF